MPVETTSKASIRVIKRYSNRKLYDVKKSRYITLEGVRELVRGGEEVRVVDNDTREDLTKLTLAQIIYEDEKRKSGVLSLPSLRWLVERGDETLRDVLRSVERSREAFDTMREATEKGVQRLVETSSDRSREFFEELMHAPQRQIETIQKRIDTQVARVTRHPSVQKELKRIERSVKQLEETITRLTQSPPAEELRKGRRGKKH